MTMSHTVTSTPNAGRDKAVLSAIFAVSAVALGFLVWLIYLREQGATDKSALSWLPAVNATFNGLAALCLTCGYVAIRMKKIPVHRALMMTAFVFSSLFLVCYIVYHYAHGDTKFLGEGIIRPIYFFILISHILLSVAMLPMIFTTFYFALSKQFARHRRLARFTFPIWLYVSVTGVAIYFFLKAHS